jgi:DNA-binding transcriptional MerR regulator
MEQIKELIDRMIVQTNLTYDRLPDIDLYMDQVIEYLSRQCISSRENDKISSAMINNYIKDGLLPRANDKKYSREHLAYLMMISRLKQMLSVKDTGLLLKADTEGQDIVGYFNDFQALVADTARSVGDSLPADDDGLSAVALRLAVSGYVSRIVCELILARLEERAKIAQEAVKSEENKEKS